MTPPLPTEPQETERMWGWSFSTPYELLKSDIERTPEFSGTGWKLVEYLLERLRRAEDRLKPVTESYLQDMFEESFKLWPAEKKIHPLESWMAAARLFVKVAP